MEKGLLTRLFKEEGFVRKTCKKCGKPFWTLDPDREFCGDQPCVDYDFIGNPVGYKFDSLREVREAFLKFFEEHGHTRIRRYPIVARWREDVYLVGASIYDFQPWVTEGIVPPPANPLTISQPCIRLTDVDNVGKTGRHLTNFEMMAHHAFNIKGQYIYWIDETVEYAFRFFTEVMKFPKEEITFKEDWWSGGGNAGEDFEVLIRGLEVATLVFMHYKVIDNQIIPMENKIIDTGYGLERLYWIIRGTPTVYDAVFEPLIEKLRLIAGIERIDRSILEKLSKYMGKIDAKVPGSLMRTKRLISKTVGISLDELEKMLRPYEALYALVDHTKALMFMLGDGIVPSNSGAGYLARLLIRRCLRNCRVLNLEIPLSEIVNLQIEYWSYDFPEYKEIRDDILEIIDYEEEKYKKTLEQGKKAISRIIRKLKKKKIKEMPLEQLILLYDSHGIAPELVKEIAEKEGIEVKIPEDFYSRLAERHEKAEVTTTKEELILKMEDLISKLPETRMLYYEEPYKFEFEAKILKIIDSRYVILDKTCFYPEGGGQPGDIGILTDGKLSCKVIDTKKVGNIVVHICDICPFKEGQIVRGIVNKERRIALMRNHTATHIILSAARRVLGRHVWQAGAQKGVKKSRLDITHYKHLTDDEIKRIERLANRVVMENRNVKIEFMPRNTAEQKYGFILYQGGVVPGPIIRVVEIENWDVEACGGLHVSKTGEVGPIKIIKTERIQDGVERLEFTVGDATLEYFDKLESTIRELSTLFSCEATEVYKKVRKLMEQNDNLRKEVTRLLDRVCELESELLLNSKVRLGKVDFVYKVYDERSRDEMLEVSIHTVKKNKKSIVFLASRKDGTFVIMFGEDVVKLGLDARNLGSIILKELRGKGGGKVDMFNGRVIEKEKLSEITQKLIEYIEKYTMQ